MANMRFAHINVHMDDLGLLDSGMWILTQQVWGGT